MDYKLEKAKKEHLSLLIDYKLKSILTYAGDLEKPEIEKIYHYVENKVAQQLPRYKIVLYDNLIIGAVMVEPYLDGILLDEIYLEAPYRNKGIGTKLIQQILSDHKIVYLWVYKLNLPAYRFYQKLGFQCLEETESRYFMKYFISNSL